MEILEKIQGIFYISFVSIFYFDSRYFFLFLFSCLLWESGFYVFPPLGFSLFPYFSFGIDVSLSSSLDHAPLSPWAQGHAKEFALRRWRTRMFDLKQIKRVL